MRLLMAAALLGGIALAGCGDDSGKNKDAGSDMPVVVGDMAHGDGGGGPETFEAYVLDQIQNHTASNTPPDDYTTKTFAATDNTDPAFFSSLFP